MVVMQKSSKAHGLGFHSREGENTETKRTDINMKFMQQF